MTDRIVYLGPYNNHRSHKLFNKAIDYLKMNKGNDFYYILPNGNLLEEYRENMIEKVNGTFDINLFTFDDIVDKLLEDHFYAHIDEELKEVLISKILKELKDENRLKYYKKVSNKKGFIRSLIRIIGEIKRSLVTTEMYFKRCPDEPFFTEIGLIYEKYEKQLNRFRLIDREGSFFKSLTLLRKDKSFFDGLDYIIIDGFFDFRPQEQEILKEITKTNCPIYINMPFNKDENYHTLLKTIEILERLGFKIEKEANKNFTYYEKIATNLFDKSKEKLEPSSHTYMIKAANSYLEMKKIAEIIKRHSLEGTDLKDMAIVLTNPEEYRNKMFQVFNEEKIPTSLNKDTNLIEIPLVKELIYFLEVKKSTKNSIINRIKSNYFNLCSSEEKEAIEYYLRKLDFDSIENLIYKDNLNTNMYIPELKSILLNIEEESKFIPEKGNIKEYIKIIMDFLEKYKIEDKILDIYNLTKDFHLFKRDISAYNKIKEILNTMANIFKIVNEEILLEEFIELLQNYFEKESIMEVQGNSKGVKILSPITARGQQFSVLFVVGLSQGKYPTIMENNFFFKDDNYEKLKSIGIDMKNYHEKMDKDSLVFSTIIAICTNDLYLSYSENSTQDEKDIPSIFLDEILNMIDGETIEEKVNLIKVDMDYILKRDKNELTTKKEIPQYLLEKYYEGEYGEELFFMYNDIDENTFKEVNDRVLCEIERNKNEFNQYSGSIGDENIIEDIKNIHKNKIYSISYLESYGRCPYYFLLNNILNVEEMEREFQDFTPLDRGVINHEVLKEYYYNYREEIQAYIEGKNIFNVDETYDYIFEKVSKKMNALGRNYNSKLWQLRIENSTERILEFIKSDLHRMTKLKKKTVPMDFEIQFGRKKPFEIKIDDLKIPFTGAIDRIDKYIDEDKYIIIDYKNSDYNIRNIDHMKSGLSLQLPLYILSQKDKNIVAALYGIISTGEFQVKIGNLEEKALVSKRNKGALTEEELEELLNTTKDFIKSYIESIYKGNFAVNPTECSPYCIYKDICRYEEILEVE
ncbi:PD-(D/E)XK nuclease family protein [Schnuerera sp.]|uniref:PD-(D/E)XK nuclease family protein n=1 Tax=Schnuerera sp. TaxID=2794844 RepID=UPI002CE64B1C|nr:PD-(D/E)XK nuclease family protein [Schnuerera sp.]HSH35546.1 PD-(D/E)XK nuclease family protein [Schnuerera sp.]